MHDLISRQAAIEVASRGCHELRGVFSDIEHGLKELPSVQPERKKGKWLNRRLVYMDVHIATCDQCGKRVVVGNFCPNCGSYNGGNSDG